ncbi:KOW motif-containing protein [Zavarzinia sp. CC-PAN008]|uniref:KOW motif-containing protein n=1 Tax=Zavarzinia sp. CC-PAN008 TaxID=3243332 RepID=UPI003F7490F8
MTATCATRPPEGRTFEVGDTVEVTAGEHQGRQGMVVGRMRCDPHLVWVYLRDTMIGLASRELALLREATPTSSGEVPHA